MENRRWRIVNYTAPAGVGSELVSKVPHGGENHHHAVLIRGVDHFIVFDRYAWLDHRFGAGIGGFIQTIAKRIESVGRYSGALEGQSMWGGAPQRKFG